MNQTTKKRIAKEVLILASTLALLGVIMLSSKMHHKYVIKQEKYYSNKYESTKNELDSLVEIYNEKTTQYQIATELIDKYMPAHQVFEHKANDETYYAKIREFVESEIQRKKEDLIKNDPPNETENQKNKRLSTFIDYSFAPTHLIQDSILDPKVLIDNAEKIAKLKKDKEVFYGKKNKFEYLRRYGISDNYTLFGIMVLLIVYPFRILFVIIRWAIKTIKE